MFCVYLCGSEVSVKARQAKIQQYDSPWMVIKVAIFIYIINCITPYFCFASSLSCVFCDAIYYLFCGELLFKKQAKHSNHKKGSGRR